MRGVGSSRRRRSAIVSVLIGTLLAGALGTASPVFAASGPIARWKLDDGSGTNANDDIGTADGSVAGNPTWLTSNAAVGAGALRFDGVNDKVTIPSSSAIEPQELMLTLWVRGDPASPPAAGQVIVERGDFGCAGATYGLYVASDGIRFSMRVEDGQQLEVTASESAQHVRLWDGSWHLLAANAYFLTSPHRTVIASLAIDGYPSPAGTFSTTLASGEYGNTVKYAGASSADLLFGAPVNAACGGTQFKGDIDDVRIYADAHFDATSLMPAVPTTLTMTEPEVAHPNGSWGSTVTVSPAPHFGSVAQEMFIDGAWTSLGSTNLYDDNGHAFFGTSQAPLAVGTYPIRATYHGGAPYEDSTNTSTLTVEKWPSTTTVQFDPAGFLPGQNIQLYGNVQSSPACPDGYPHGSVKYWDTTPDPDVLLQTVALVEHNGASCYSDAYWSISGGLSTGTHTIVAEYVGPDPYIATSSSAEKSLVVHKFTPTVTLQRLSPDPNDPTAPVETTEGILLGSTIQNAGALYAHDATITFTKVGDDTPICVVAVNLNDFTSCQVPSLELGWTDFIATYSGNSDTEAGVSTKFTQMAVANVVHVSGVGAGYTTFYPVKDGYRDTVSIHGTSQEIVSGTIRIYRPTGSLLKTVTIPSGSGPWSYSWNGRKSDGTILPEGKYKVVQTLTDGTDTKAVTSYVSLSKKTITWHTTTISKVGSSVSATGANFAAGVTLNTSSGYARLSSSNDGSSFAAAGWQLQLPSADTYKFYVRIYGRRSTGTGFNALGAQYFPDCPYVATGPWNLDCFGAWANIAKTSGTTLHYYPGPSLSSGYRSGRKVRITVLTTGGTIYVYKAQVVVTYGVLHY